jgi:hypothetical protein
MAEAPWPSCRFSPPFFQGGTGQTRVPLNPDKLVCSLEARDGFCRNGLCRSGFLLRPASPRIGQGSRRAFGATLVRARSSAEEHYVDIVGVTGSIPVAPTNTINDLALWAFSLAADMVSSHIIADRGSWVGRYRAKYHGEGAAASDSRSSRIVWRSALEKLMLSSAGSSPIFRALCITPVGMTMTSPVSISRSSSPKV